MGCPDYLRIIREPGLFKLLYQVVDTRWSPGVNGYWMPGAYWTLGRAVRAVRRSAEREAREALQRAERTTWARDKAPLS